MKTAFFDPCSLYQMENIKLIGDAGLENDDYFITGTASYQHAEELYTRILVTRKATKLSFRSLDKHIQLDEEKASLYLSQDLHIKKLKLIHGSTIDHDLLRLIRDQLFFFIAQTSRPDINYQVSQLCKIKYNKDSCITRSYEPLP